MFEKGIPMGMQMLLAQLIRAAAPQLAEQVDAVSKVVQNFDQRLVRVELMCAQILEECRDRPVDGSTGTADATDQTRSTETS